MWPASTSFFFCELLCKLGYNVIWKGGGWLYWTIKLHGHVHEHVHGHVHVMGVLLVHNQLAVGVCVRGGGWLDKCNAGSCYHGTPVYMKASIKPWMETFQWVTSTAGFIRSISYQVKLSVFPSKWSCQEETHHRFMSTVATLTPGRMQKLPLRSQLI